MAAGSYKPCLARLMFEYIKYCKFSILLTIGLGCAVATNATDTAAALWLLAVNWLTLIGNFQCSCCCRPCRPPTLSQRTNMLSADAAAPHRPTSNSDLCLTFVQLVLFCQLLLHPICLAERAIDWHMEVVKVTCHHYQGVELIERHKNDGEGRYFIVQCGCWSRQHYRWDFAAETNSSSFYICSTACHYACLRPSPTWSGSLLALLWTTVTTTTLTLLYLWVMKL